MRRSLLRNLKGSILRDDTAVHFQAVVNDTIWLLQNSSDSFREQRRVREADSAFASIPKSRKVPVKI